VGVWNVRVLVQQKAHSMRHSNSPSFAGIGTESLQVHGLTFVRSRPDASQIRWRRFIVGTRGFLRLVSEN
jgi:hypothetical protein